MINKKSRIYLTGHNGLVGSSILRRLNFFGYKNVITISSNKLDLRNQNKVERFINRIKPNAIINAAATVGGIVANNLYRAEFIYNNLSIQTNIIHACHKFKVKNLIFLGSSCVYPRHAKQPIKEKYLLNGVLEKTNELSFRKKIFEEALEILSEREREIISLRKLRDKPIKLEELSKKFNISRERVRQIEEKAFEKLQNQVSIITK